MNSTLRIHVNKLSMRGDIDNPSVGRQGLVGHWDCLTTCGDQTSHFIIIWRGVALEVVLWSLHACTHTCVWSVCAHTNTHNLKTKWIFSSTYFPFRRTWTWFQPALTLYTQQIPEFRSLDMDEKERNGICSQFHHLGPWSRKQSDNVPV